MAARTTDPVNRVFDAGGGEDQRTRVLMVDDDVEEHLLVAVAAQDQLHPPVFEFVTSGEELLLRLTAVTAEGDLPDLILLDFQMHGMGSLRTLEQLQADPVLWQIPVVVVTDTFRIEDEVACYQRGATRFEDRPRTVGAMIDFVSKLLRFARRSQHSLPLSLKSQRFGTESSTN